MCVHSLSVFLLTLSRSMSAFVNVSNCTLFARYDSSLSQSYISASLLAELGISVSTLMTCYSIRVVVDAIDYPFTFSQDINMWIDDCSGSPCLVLGTDWFSAFVNPILFMSGCSVYLFLCEIYYQTTILLWLYQLVIIQIVSNIFCGIVIIC